MILRPKRKTPFAIIHRPELSSYRQFQAKLTFIGNQTKPIPTLAITSFQQPLEMTRFKFYVRPNVHYANDDRSVWSFTITPEEAKRFVDGLATEPHLLQSRMNPYPIISLMIMRILGNGGDECFESIITLDDVSILFAKLRTALNSNNQFALWLVEKLDKIVRGSP